MVWVEALIPFDKGELLSTIHHVGMVEKIVSNLSSILCSASSEGLQLVGSNNKCGWLANI